MIQYLSDLCECINLPSADSRQEIEPLRVSLSVSPAEEGANKV